MEFRPKLPQAELLPISFRAVSSLVRCAPVDAHETNRSILMPRMVIVSFRSISALIIGVLVSVTTMRCQKPPSNRANEASMGLQQTWAPTVLMPWVSYGADFGGVSGWNVQGVSTGQSYKNLDEWFSRLQHDGVRVVAWFLFGDGRGAFTFDDSGDVQALAPSFLSDYQAALRLAKTHNLQLIWIMMDFQIGLPAELDAHGVRMFGHADLIQNSAKRRSFIENGLDPLLRATGDFQQIAGWIVINEPENLLRKGYVSEAEMRSFIIDVTLAIKRHDTGQHVAVANSDLVSMIQFSDIESLDFRAFHHYHEYLPPPAELVQAYLLKLRTTGEVGKPIFVGEFDLGSPPGGDLSRFLLTSRIFGYAGAWAWSLLKDTKSDTTLPRFDEVDSYAKSVGSLSAALWRPDSADANDLHAWALSHSHLDLPSIEQRISIVRRDHNQHQVDQETNEEWEGKAQNELVVADENLKSAPTDRQKALSDIQANESWVSRAGSSDIGAAKAALQKSQEWLKVIDSRLNLEEVRKGQQDLANAEERIRMHTYFVRETESEIGWLNALRERLQNPEALKSLISGEIEEAHPPSP